MKRLCATCVVIVALFTLACTDERKPYLPDFDPDVRVDPAGALPPGSVPGGSGGGSSDAGDVYPDTVPDAPDAGDQ